MGNAKRQKKGRIGSRMLYSTRGFHCRHSDPSEFRSENEARAIMVYPSPSKTSNTLPEISASPQFVQ